MTIKTKKIAIKQRGAALIAVLIILVVITLLGVTAMRMGLTSLTLATNSQVSQLLFQSADMGTASLMKLVQQDTATAMKVGGVIGYQAGNLYIKNNFNILFLVLSLFIIIIAPDFNNGNK